MWVYIAPSAIPAALVDKPSVRKSCAIAVAKSAIYRASGIYQR